MVFNEKLFEALIEVDSKILARIIDKLEEAHHYGKIYVGDGDLSCDKIYHLSEKKEGLTAYLIVEEDDEVNWYFLTEENRGDFIVTSRHVEEQ